MTSARLIRRDILESERVAKLPDSGKWLFVAILLVADDLGLFEATVHRLHKASDLKHDIVAGLLDRMVELDLVRLYPGPGARTFGFIPRYGQRLQIKRVKHPLPPPALYADDEDAVSKFKHLAPESTVQHGNPPRSTAIHGNPPPEPEPEPEGKEIGTGSLRSPVPVAGAVAPSDLEAGKTRIKRKADPDKPWLKVADHCPHVKLVALYHELLPTLARVSVWDARREQYSRARWREQAALNEWESEEDGLRFFSKFFRYVAGRCPHLMGMSNPREPGGPVFAADLEWLLRPTNFRKTIEGKYER